MRRWWLVGMLGMSQTLFASAADDYNKGVEAYQRGDFPTAESAFEKAARENKLKGRALYNLGNTRARQGRLDEAIKAYQDALRLDPAEKRIQENLQWAEKLREQKPPESQQQQNDQQQQQQDQQNQQNGQPQQQQQSGESQKTDKDQRPSDQQESQDASSRGRNEDEKNASPDQAPSQKAGEERGQGGRPEGELSREDAERMIDAVPERSGVRSDGQQGGKRGGSTLDW